LHLTDVKLMLAAILVPSFDRLLDAHSLSLLSIARRTNISSLGCNK
jgi:hypothetical protein